MRIRRRHPVASKEIKSFRDSLNSVLMESDLDALLSGHIESATSNDYEVVFSGKEPVLFAPDGDIFPTVRGFLRVEPRRRYLCVDTGAVPYVANGADIMSPGVVRADPDLRKGDLCVVTEERHNKPLSIARMIVDASEIDRGRKGKVAKNLHHIGDSLWKATVS